MSDISTGTTAAETVVDPVAEARRQMAEQGQGGSDIERLKGQVKALWIVSIVTLVLLVALAGLTLLPRVFGVGVLGQTRPDGFTPGMGRQFQQGAPQGGQTTPQGQMMPQGQTTTP